MEIVSAIIVGFSMLYVAFGTLAALVHIWNNNNPIATIFTWFFLIVAPYLLIIIFSASLMLAAKPIRIIVAIAFAYVSYLYGYSLYNPVN